MIRVCGSEQGWSWKRQIRPYRSARKSPRPPEDGCGRCGWRRGFRRTRLRRRWITRRRWCFQTERSEQRKTISLHLFGADGAGGGVRRGVRAGAVDAVAGKDRALEMVEQELWRKRFTRRIGVRGKASRTAALSAVGENAASPPRRCRKL